MHLNSLRIINFKSHADTLLTFQEITSLVGKNDSGKTNILRALKLLLHHNDWPASWIRYGQESASIELTLIDGTKITRKRTKTGQSVIISSPSGVVTSYEGKKDATEFIEKAVGIRKITLDETTGPEDLNFVDVNEGPYLLGSRSDTVQRKIAGIVGANKIDDARARLAKTYRKLETDLSQISNSINTLSPLVSNNRAVLNKVDALLKEQEKVQDLWNNNNAKSQELNDLLYHIKNISSLIPTTNVVANITSLYGNLVRVRSLLTQKTKDLESTARINKELNSFHLRVEKHSDITEKFRAMIEIREAYNTINNNIIIANKFKELINLKGDILGLSEQLNILQVERQMYNEQLKDIVCPTCGRKNATI